SRSCLAHSYSVSSVYLFILLLLPLCPSLSPPFPYTTLFRSSFLRAEHAVLRAVGGDQLPQHPRVLRLVARAKTVDRHHVALLDEDRKSTRLNSSHVKISYAVFCLKKKKKHHIVSIVRIRINN